MFSEKVLLLPVADKVEIEPLRERRISNRIKRITVTPVLGVLGVRAKTLQ